MSSENQLIKNNYHTHMYLCRHATGTVEDYVKEAIRLGFDSLGMSDHAPWKKLIDRSVRMHLSDYPKYLKQLDEAIEKYSDRIKIYKAVEIEYFSKEEDHYKNLLKDLDYLVLGQHYIEKGKSLISVYRITSIEDLTIYKDTLIKAMKTGCFKFIAHPDLFLFSQKELSEEVLSIAEEIIIAAKEHDIPLEINANGIRKDLIDLGDKKLYRYPREEFWKLVKKHEAKVIISSDAHKPDQLFDYTLIKAFEFSRQLNLTVEEELQF
mgnify:CR=1 FL=1